MSTEPFVRMEAASAERCAALADAEGPLSPACIAQALDALEGQRFRALSREGRPVHGVYRSGPGPAVLISGGQHANETSGVVGALRAAHVLQQRGDAHFAVIASENPDGYALHQTLCQTHPRHMHHAARYKRAGRRYRL